MSKPQKRSSRYFRKNNFFRIRNVINYIPLLEIIAESRYINTAQINALVQVSENKVSKVKTNLKLKKLFHNGYVDRLCIATTKVRQGSSKIIYTLTKKGMELLVEKEPAKFKEIYYPKKTLSCLFVSHELMITNFKVCLISALKNRKKMELITWMQGKELEEKMEKYQVKGNVIYPDGYFGIRMIDEVTGEKKKSHYFLEADRGTMKLAKFYNKIKRYRKFFSQSSGNRKKLPSIFFVVTITSEKKRAENLRTITIQGDPQKQGSQRFLFSSEAQFCLDEFEEILNSIFMVGLNGAGETRRSLLI